MTRGACHIGSRHATGWRSAAYIAGDIGITLPGRPLVLRWELLADSPFETVHIHLPVAAFERYMLEEPHISSTDLESLDVLSTPDPVVTAMAKSIVEAHRLGAGELHAEYAAQYLVAHLLAPRETRTPERGVLSPQAGFRQRQPLHRDLRPPRRVLTEHLSPSQASVLIRQPWSAWWRWR